MSLGGSGQPALEIAMSAENVETRALNTPTEKKTDGVLIWCLIHMKNWPSGAAFL